MNKCFLSIGSNYLSQGSRQSRLKLLHSLRSKTILNVSTMTNVKRNIRFVLREQNRRLADCVRDSKFIKDIRIAAGAVRDYDLCLQDASPYIAHYDVGTKEIVGPRNCQ